MKQKIMLIGEPMGLLIAQEEANLEDVRSFTSSIAGAEYNVAIGLTRLGHNVDYMTKLGNDAFGKKILKSLRENGISDKRVFKTDDHITGLMLKAKTSHGDPDICYYRKNSAASTLCIDDVKDINLSEYAALHITGIFPPLSKSCRETALFLMKRAKEAGITTFFDPNLRPQLWESQDVMVSTLNEFADYADYILPGYKEGKILCGSSEPDKIAKFYLDKGAKGVIVKVGADGAVGYTKDERIHSYTYPTDYIVDTVGAGDGFAVGIISSVLEGLPLEKMLQRANAIGTMQILSPSDNEDLPTREQLTKFISEHKQGKIK